MCGESDIDQRPGVAQTAPPNSNAIPQLASTTGPRPVLRKSRVADHSSLAIRQAGILIASDNLLETALTPSMPTRDAFLIANICPTFFFRPPPPRAFLIATANY
jgi:hypothetical protein